MKKDVISKPTNLPYILHNNKLLLTVSEYCYNINVKINSKGWDDSIAINGFLTLSEN